jgi:hypothetical protein
MQLISVPNVPSSDLALSILSKNIGVVPQFLHVNTFKQATHYLSLDCPKLDKSNPYHPPPYFSSFAVHSTCTAFYIIQR